LLQLLAQLRLASRDDVLAVGRRARRLARGLPLFDSVWVDALAQARVLTPYQAQQVNAGRGESLKLRDWVICRPASSPAYAQAFEARANRAGRPVRLVAAPLRAQDHLTVQKQLETLVSISRRVGDRGLTVVTDGGVDEINGSTCLWCISDIMPGVSAREWLIPNGRMPHEAVLQIARRMTAMMARLERFELLHTDLSPVNLVLGEDGEVHLGIPGIRSLVRPEEGYGDADVAPEAYDYISPERIVEGIPANTASELYACGTLWWHLLTGRPPISGGDSLAKLCNLQKGRIPDVRQLAPETPECLAQAIARCTRSDAAKRGSSFADLAQELGPPTDDGAQLVSACVHRHLHPEIQIHSARRRSTAVRLTRRMVAAATVAMALLCAFWFGRHPMGAPKALVPPPRIAADSLPPSAVGEAQQDEREAAPAPAVELPPVQLDSVTLTVEQAAAGHLPSLRPGMTIRGDPGSRPKLVVPPQGLVIDQPHVRLENVDFVWQWPISGGDRTAMVWLHSRWVEFHRCSFQSAELPLGSPHPVAVGVVQVRHADSRRSATGSTKVIMDHCVLRRVAAGVGHYGTTSLAIESFGSLHLGPGPLLMLEGYPASDQSVKLSLKHFTLRGASALTACHYDALPSRPGRMSIAATNCVFAPQVDGAVIRCVGPDNPRALLELVRWSGHGSLISPDAPLAMWHADDGNAAPVDDADFSVAGLARGTFEFSGPQLHEPASSRLRKFNGPLRGTAQPGIGAADLHIPRLASE
jgi:serine/threonine-protein kinase